MTHLCVPPSPHRTAELISSSPIVKIIDECVLNPQERRQETRRRARRVWKGGEWGGAGADFSLVASGLRQFGFQQRLESGDELYRRAKTGTGVANHCARASGPPSLPPPYSRRRSPGLCAVVFYTRESQHFRARQVNQTRDFPFSTSDRARSKKWLRSLPAGKNLVSKLLNLWPRLFLEHHGVRCVFLSTGCRIYIYF
jgi:hypothetical protein